MRLLVPLTWIAMLFSAASASAALAPEAALLQRFARDASAVVRGVCESASPIEVQVAGATLAATEYVFLVTEAWKGSRSPRLRFRQVGRAGGGRGDLGRLAGLPMYQPGQEYVLFLLPPSASGLSSPAGAGEAAFAVDGVSARWLRAGHNLTARTSAALVQLQDLPASPAAASAASAAPLPLSVLRRAVRRAATATAVTP